ncbi:MAG: CapA family protein [Clostridia bacterium]|nr:CapA family protein [Clostridia bacterium]
MKILILYVVISLLLSGCAKTEPVSTAPVEVPDEIISVVAVGDNLLHMPVINSGKQPDGSYDFSHIFEVLQPIFTDADLSVIGQETVFGGEHLGYSGYPLFNSPEDVGITLIGEGFDIVLHASNHVLDKWASGVENTLDFWENYPDITVLGINRSHDEKDKVKIKNVKGAKIAVLNYTYDTNGLVLPPDKTYLVNYINGEQIKKDCLYAEDNANFTIAFMHWGTEYSTKPNQQQIDLCNQMCEYGVDLIIGAHPHVIQPVEWYQSENGNKMLVYYSLGNFVSSQLEAKNLFGGLADVKLRFDGSSVTIDNYSFMPIVTHYNSNFDDFDVYPLKEYSSELSALHGLNYKERVSVEYWRNFVVNVFDGYDTGCLDY